MVNYPYRRNWQPYFIHRNSAMTALSPWRNKHGVLTHHVSLCSHFFTLSSHTSARPHIQISAPAEGVCADRTRCDGGKYGTGSFLLDAKQLIVCSFIYFFCSILDVLIVVGLKYLTDLVFLLIFLLELGNILDSHKSIFKKQMNENPCTEPNHLMSNVLICFQDIFRELCL